MKLTRSLVVVTLALGMLLGVESAQQPHDLDELIRTTKEEINAKLVRDTYTAVWTNGATDPEAALVAWENGYHPDVVQHNPTGPSGRDFYLNFIGENRPSITYEIGAVFADGDYVVVHFRVSAPDFYPQKQVGVEILRCRGGFMVEHWDLLQTEVLPNATASGNAMFPIPSPPEHSGPNEEDNKRRVTFAVNRLYTHADASVVDEYFAGDVQQHGATANNGRQYLRDLAASRSAGEVPHEIGFAAAYGDYVVLHSRVAHQVVLEIFKVDPESGLITDIWDMAQDEVPAVQSVSGNSMYPIW